ncbi:meiotic recombination protein REC8 homolog [Haliaeetus albicilla]|uniref:meiotic recombination protein REC8 homolog n=1 Tax=Haliaeetus albicilla TaxID=8969 RepID=UPI0037E848F8
MFYYPEVLRRRTGCFGTVWYGRGGGVPGWVWLLFGVNPSDFGCPPPRLAATCSWRLLPRDYLSVDVPRAWYGGHVGRGAEPSRPRPAHPFSPPAAAATPPLPSSPRPTLFSPPLFVLSAAVEAFVIGRGGWEVPPPPAGAPPPRCSLYLAALLQLGLARVYRRQCGWLLEEAAQVLGRLQRARPPPNIDLSPPRRLQLVADAQALMAALELAPDPFFGVMGPGLPSPTELPQVQRLLEEAPPVEILPPVAPPPTVSPEKITLREPEPIVLPALEEELPEVTARELQLLMEVEGELLPPALRPPEEPTLPPPPPEVPPPRRRPPHLDPQPQIPQDRFKAQLLRPRGHCRPLVLLEPPHERRRPPGELLRAPTCGWLPPDLWGLWGRCARPRPPPPPAPPELPSEVEVLREALEPSLPALPSSEISLEITEEELRPRLLPPEERRPPPPPPPPALPELPERPEPELPPAAALDTPALRRLVAAEARRVGGTELGALVPPGAPRSLVGRLFYLCLELCGAGWLRLEQAQPYGPIAVGPGPRGPPPMSPPAVGREGAAPPPHH